MFRNMFRNKLRNTISRRDVFAVLPAFAATGAFAFAEAHSGSKPEMGSDVFDWNAIPVHPKPYGSARPFFSAPTATLENLELHVTTLNPGQQPHAPHRHPNEEMLIVREGAVEALSNGTWKPAGPGSVIFNASNQLHGVRNRGTVPAVYHVINWKTAATPKA
ncbi:MAG TPA: cupin domain-containing protein [Terracidiphilus sp.]|nr:cupin domain-containing protein [Terracidiphilus sp.]